MLTEKKTLDLLTSGNVIGEKSILTGERTATGSSCETDVQVSGRGESDSGWGEVR